MASDFVEVSPAALCYWRYAFPVSTSAVVTADRRKLKLKATLLLKLLLGFWFSGFVPAQAQTGRTQAKLTNAYRGNYQRVTTGCESVNTFEIRNGTLWAWGANSYGVLGDGTTMQRLSPIKIGADNTWVTIAAGQSHTLGLKGDGTLWAWGLNTDGQLGIASGITESHSPVQIGNETKWVSIAAGSYHSAALKSDGTLWTWGDNTNGQLGDGATTDRNSPMQIGTDNNWVSISAGYQYTLALKNDGTLWAWGRNTAGQLGNSGTTEQHSPVQIGTDNNWVSVAAGETHSLALKSDGTLWAWGDNRYGTLGNGTTDQHTSPIQIGTDNKWVRVAVGVHYSVGLKSDGTLWAWGFNGDGELGDGTTTDRLSPVQIGTDNNWVSIAAGANHSVGLKSDGTLRTWGFNNYGQLGIGAGQGVLQSSPIVTSIALINWVSVAEGDDHTAGVKSDGTLWAWGNSSYGQLGIGTIAAQTTPAQVGTDTKWIGVAAGYQNTMGLKSDGTLWAWGNGSYGKLGDGPNVSHTSPVQIGTDTKWVSMAAGGDHSMGLKSDGTLWTWGHGENGRLGLGDGNIQDQYSPVQVGTDNNWVSIAAGAYYSMGLKSDGTLWAWGDNSYGQLGDGTTTSRTSPVQVGTDKNWVSMVGGQYFTIALKSDGTRWAWGYNAAGTLGDGTTTDQHNPEQIGTDNTWISVAAGYAHALGLKSNGTLWAWGNNGEGSLGDGTKPVETSPVTIATSAPIVSLFLGSIAHHSVIIDVSRQTLCTTGLNTSGQLGNGTTVQSNTFSCGVAQANPLPVTLVSFTAKAQENRTVELAWTTSLETNNKGYLIERSKDLKHFEKVGTVTELGASSNSLKTYHLTDLTPYWGTSYYRLTQIDLNGQSTVYPAVSVVLRDGAYGVFPNPVSDQSFTLSLDEPETALINFYDSDGRVMQLQKLGVQSRNLLLKTSGKLATGVYILTVEERGQTRQHRLVVD